MAYKNNAILLWKIYLCRFSNKWHQKGKNPENDLTFGGFY